MSSRHGLLNAGNPTVPCTNIDILQPISTIRTWSVRHSLLHVQRITLIICCGVNNALNVLYNMSLRSPNHTLSRITLDHEPVHP